jgi:hypothetical protein
MGINMELVPSFAAIAASTLLEMLSIRYWNMLQGLASIQSRKLAIRAGSQSAFKFVPKVFDGVEVSALFRPVKFFHTDLDKPFLYGPLFVHRGHCHVKT